MSLSDGPDGSSDGVCTHRAVLFTAGGRSAVDDRSSVYGTRGALSRRRVMNRSLTHEDLLAAAIEDLDPLKVALSFWRHEEMVVLERLIPEPLVRAIRDEVISAEERVVRRAVPGYKRSGSISRFRLQEVSPSALALYRSDVVRAFLSALADVPLELSPEDDPHACAVYWYAQEGDRVGYHYDTSWYEGARYTVLVGLSDDSSARLHCRVHARDRHRPTRELMIRTAPGTVVFFNGDKLLHGVTPLGADAQRVVLTMQYVTDPRMRGWRRAVSNLKDAFAYFGLEALRPGRPRLGSGEE